MILSEAVEAVLKSHLKVGRIIWGALIWGQLIFLVIVFYLQGQREAALDESEANLLIALGAGLVGVGILAAVGMRVLRISILGKADTFKSACERLFRMLIIGMAILEGACVFCLVQILLGQRMDVMLGLVGLALLGQLSFWPMKDGWVRVWMESREVTGLKE